MKKYLTPDAAITTLSSQDVITFSITSISGGNSISWEALKEKAGIGDGFGDDGMNN